MSRSRIGTVTAAVAAALAVGVSVAAAGGEAQTCKRQVVKGVPLLVLGMGARTQNVATNGGLPYFGLTVSGPAAHPTGGGVIAYWKGKRWGGRGVSFRGTASGGTFVVRGINGSRGTARGSFRCSG